MTGLKAVLSSPACKLYITHGLSTWNVRMWSLVLPIALYSVGGSLRLLGVLGVANGMAILIFGAAIGKWIDKTSRIKAAQLCLIIGNSAIVLCAAALVALIHWKTKILDVCGNIIMVVVAVMCIVSSLAGAGYKICLTKDWIVVMCKDNGKLLAGMNAMLLRIDLVTKIVSPLVGGQIMTSLSVAAGCYFIAFWHICSTVVELIFLRALNRAVPEIAANKLKHPPTPNSESAVPLTSCEKNCSADGQKNSMLDDDEPKFTPLPKAKGALKAAVSGWKCYFQQSVFTAALGLAFLYLTVLGLDGITSGYAYSQGIQENLIAVIYGVSALFGILGSFACPLLREKFGLQKTATIFIIFDLMFLLFCVVSIFLPGSPFQLNPVTESHSKATSSFNVTDTVAANFSEHFTDLNSTQNIASSMIAVKKPDSMCSIWTFLLGCVIARAGLWGFDLSITQIMQESIPERDRGAVFGVQTSLTMLFQLIKDLLVVCLPDPRTFGVLIGISWLMVFSGAISFSYYSRKARGHQAS